MVFFVLSGYLVGGSVSRIFAANLWSWTHYVTKRLVRLWIVLIPAIFIGILIDSIGNYFFDQAGSIYSAPNGQEYVKPEFFGQEVYVILRNIFFLQSISNPTAGTNIALWSLSNEFRYYLAFPLILLTFVGTIGRISCAVAAAGIFVLIGVHASYLFLNWVLGAVISLAPRHIPQCVAVKAALGAAAVFLLGNLRLWNVRVEHRNRATCRARFGCEIPGQVFQRSVFNIRSRLTLF
jgi:peptidoglycan/LPS O-acetylase OafA/YrhL